MIEKALPGLHLDTRRILNDNTYPVKLRIYHGGKRKYYSLKVNLAKIDFEKINSGNRLNEKLRDIKFDLEESLFKAHNVIDELDYFTFEKFERNYFQAKRNDKDLANRFNLYISDLRKEDRIGTADSYENALNSITSFRKNLCLDDISKNLLSQYEAWMISKKKSPSTIGIYLRCLRSIINQAIDLGIISSDSYPFGKNKYVIPGSRNVKKALKVEEIKKIFEYKSTNESAVMARDYWIFSYLCNGINMMDICKLKYKNIVGDKIIFLRSKTLRTSKNDLKPIVAIINDHIKSIIEHHGNENRDPENYVFPILYSGVSPEREKAIVKQFTKNINKWINKIAEDVDIDKRITTYTARHSFSTVLKRSGASIELISESLGHSDLKTTENYLDSFEDSVKKEFYDNLVKF